MLTHDTDIDTDDVQRLILRASKKQQVHHVFVKFLNSVAGKQFVLYLVKRVTWMSDKLDNQRPEVSVGFSFKGLEAMNVPDGYLHIFRYLAPAYSQGAGVRAAEHLGDVRADATRFWNEEFLPENSHAVITIHSQANDNETTNDTSTLPVIKDLIKANPDIEATAILYGCHLDTPRQTEYESEEDNEWYSSIKGPSNDALDADSTVWVHFGYRDGLSSNKIRTCKDQGTGPNIHEPGELLLGEQRNTGDNPWALVERSTRVRRFFKHSSFGALRVVEQDEKSFRAQVETWGRKLQREWQAPDSLATFVRAKLCGRWPNGQIVRTEDTSGKQPEPIQQTNDLRGGNFDYSSEEAGVDATSSDSEVANRDPTRKLNDPTGCGCPFASHIRRMNPRNNDGTQARPRPLFRRGVPYGPWYIKNKNEDTPRGLLGLFFCSDLHAQFEHVLGKWADQRPLGNPGDRNLKDPLIGAHSNSRDSFTITRGTPDRNESFQSSNINDFKPFVRTRGTLYCFYPSKQALLELCNDEWLDDKDIPWLRR